MDKVSPVNNQADFKLSDFVVEYLYNHGVRSCFYVSGGAVLHLVDSASQHNGIRMVCSQHEQAAATSADGVSRVSDFEIGFCLTTSGPGATNLLTGVCNSYFDSIPLICITGQVASFRKRKSGQLRQFGFQETDIVSIFKPITKYAVQLERPEDILYELGKAVYLAKSGRPGPVLIDIPDDFQRVRITPSKLRGFTPATEIVKSPKDYSAEVSEIVESVSKARRPILLIGAGVNIAKAAQECRKFVEHLGIPTLLTWGGMDILNDSDPLNFGGLGVCGPRVGNWVVQSSDLILIVGSRLSQQITGSKLEDFAPNAKKIMIDIDPEEFHKFRDTGLVIDKFLDVDIATFLRAVNSVILPELHVDQRWLAAISSIKREYSIWQENSALDLDVNVYEFMEKMSDALEESDVIVTDAGGNLSWTMQAVRVTKLQKIFSAWNHSPMGYSLPAAIGAAISSPLSKILCIIGDGGIMMTLSEIATIRRNALNIKIIVINNLGHGIQKQTIETWLDSNYVGVDEASGLYFPNFEAVAQSFDIRHIRVSTNSEILELFQNKIWLNSEPVLIEVMVDKNQRITPMLKFGTGLSDLNPRVDAPNLIE